SGTGDKLRSAHAHGPRSTLCCAMWCWARLEKSSDILNFAVSAQACKGKVGRQGRRILCLMTLGPDRCGQMWLPPLDENCSLLGKPRSSDHAWIKLPAKQKGSVWESWMVHFPSVAVTLDISQGNPFSSLMVAC
uniref:Uncharacterized protein n=1 Tax=Apteryx owenii TaxID=8824 RepID=A0A8B9PP33_APTOW